MKQKDVKSAKELSIFKAAPLQWLQPKIALNEPISACNESGKNQPSSGNEESCASSSSEITSKFFRLRDAKAKDKALAMQNKCHNSNEKLDDTGKQYRKTRVQSQLLWQMLTLYKGQIPDKSAIKEIAKELQMPRRTVYKWFWDRINQNKKKSKRCPKNE